MTVTLKSLVESYSGVFNSYRKESEKKAREGLDNTPKFSDDEINEYIDGDTKELSKYNSSNGRHIETNKVYDKPIEEFNSLISQPSLNEHQKMRIFTNLLRHNTLVDAKGGGEPHEYATDIQESHLFKGYDPKHGLLHKFDDIHDDIRREKAEADDIYHTQQWLIKNTL